MKIWIERVSYVQRDVRIHLVPPKRYLMSLQWWMREGICLEGCWDGVKRYLGLEESDYPTGSDLIEYDLSGKGRVVCVWEWR